jgi:redox-sensitive bicupin YhaK (pirin superfamily)
MEIVTYVLEGALEHKDSLGTGSVIVPGDVQRMSAGTGILHSEFNSLKDKQVHLLQIWILPAKDGIQPSYEQKNFTEKRKPGQMTLLVSPDGRDESITIHQNAFMYVLDLDNEQQQYNIAKGRAVWIQMARGNATVNGQEIKQGDGVAVAREDALQFSTGKAEIIIFDLPEV